MKTWLGLLALLMATHASRGQEIVLSDFEETNYAWLPGGAWAATGSCFGTGPAHGATAGQQTVDGFLGNGLVNTYLGGDANVGTLVSPPFTIQRRYVKFLIGGGSYLAQGGYGGETRLNLLVNGEVVAHAAGPGEWEHLDWEQWDVAAFAGQTAQLKIIDSVTNGWGHLNVDEIVESDESLTVGVITPTNQFINFPVKLGNPYHVVALLVNGLSVQEFNLPLGSATNHDFYAFLDLSAYQNTAMVERVDSTNGAQLADFLQSNAPVTDVPFYDETLRPVFHFTPKRGFNNDPNGMVYDNGVYHLCYQHNPYDVVVGNQNWGHAESADLVHWQEMSEAICGDALGQVWSGSSVLDWNNSAGFGSNVIVSFYTSAGGHANNNLMSEGQLFGQSMAYSLDAGQTWVKYSNNPVVPNVAGDNRDPKVIWYAPGKKWVMVFWLQNNDFGFFSSTDLIHWKQTSTFTFPGVIEVPELFPMPLDGDTNNLMWIFYAGAGNYFTGQFDGGTFTASDGPYSIRGGNCFAAGQTFNNIPAADGRRILFANATASFPNMPFNAGMDFPVQLTLETLSGVPQLCVNPVDELALLRVATNSWPAQPLFWGNNVMPGVAGEAYELDAQFQPGAASSVTLTLSGNAVTYDNIHHQLSCEGISQPLATSNGVVSLQMLVDRGFLEIYANGGQLYMPMSTTPVAGPQPISLTATGNGAQLQSLTLYALSSVWPATPPYIATQPLAQIAHLGGPASFSVTASSTTVPLLYQWFQNGRAIPGATNNVLSLFPVAGTNAMIDVVVSNSAGAVTSSVASLTVIPPYRIAYWSMESQITAPNNAGVPTFAGVADSATNAGEGIYATGSLPAAIDDLITFNGLAGGAVTLSPEAPPVSMFVNGHNGGAHSYNAETITNVDGALFFPQDQYGDEMDLVSPFSLELFFKTDGNESGAGVMQLLAQGTDTGQVFRYGITVNEPEAGAARFRVANSFLEETNTADLTDRNYADGQWHYVIAVCDTGAGTNGQLRLTIVNPDASESSATNNLLAGFLPLPAQNNGNLFLGRNTYPVNANPETFRGLIDEVQITAGVTPDSWRIGKIPSVDNYPQFSNVTAVSSGVSFDWTGAAPTNFVVQWTGRFGDSWRNIATVPSADREGPFIDTNTARTAGVASFYRVVAE